MAGVGNIDLGFSIALEFKGLNDVFFNPPSGLGAIREIHNIVDVYLRKAQAQATQNISGISVNYNGGSFVINRVTGKLVRSIQIIKGTNASDYLSGFVVAGADYAAAIEEGHDAIDLKARLMGKVIPFQVNGSKKEKEAAAAAGTAKKMRKRFTTGKTAKFEYISFRKIGPNSKGWIIPAQKPRPFMQATAEEILPKFQNAVVNALAKYVNGE